MKIPYNVRKVVYEEAIKTFGTVSQIWMAVEEMSELTKELAKGQRPNGTSAAALADEIADVTIMMEQLGILFEVNQQVQDRIDFKVERLAQRIEEAREEQHG